MARQSDAERPRSAEWRSPKSIAIGRTPSSAILLCVAEGPEESNGKRNVNGPLALGLSLCDGTGKELVDVADKAEQRRPGESWEALRLLVDPGYYRLRLKLDGGEFLYQSIFVPRNWCIQLFLHRTMRCYKSGAFKPNLADVAILMRRPETAKFDPNDPDARLADLARLGLARRQQVLSEAALKEIIMGKLRDPMLGLYGAHLLLLAHWPAPFTACLDAVNQHLKKMFASTVTFTTLVRRLESFPDLKDHPDVEALRVLLGEGTRPFPDPPMFRQSWSIVVQATAQKPELVPATSTSSEAALQIINQGPWLLWRSPYASESVNRQLIAGYREVLEEVLPRIERTDIPKEQRSDDAERVAFPDAVRGLKPETFPSFYMNRIGVDQRQQLVRALEIPTPNIEQIIAEIICHTPKFRSEKALVTIETNKIGSKAAQELHPSVHGTIRLKPGQRFSVQITYRRKGFATVVLMGPNSGLIRSPVSQGKNPTVEARSYSLVGNLVAPNERALLIAVVTARPLADALREHLKDELNRFPGEIRGVLDRIGKVVQDNGQEWMGVGYVTLAPAT
jgi:hypothetical protein